MKIKAFNQKTLTIHLEVSLYQTEGMLKILGVL